MKTSASKTNSSKASIPAGEFKARCLSLMDEVALTRRPLVITKHGKAVARIVPMEPEASIFGSMQGTAEIRGDIVEGLGLAWDVEHGE